MKMDFYYRWLLLKQDKTSKFNYTEEIVLCKSNLSN
jgi:hypothetical protein